MVEIRENEGESECELEERARKALERMVCKKKVGRKFEREKRMEGNG